MTPGKRSLEIEKQNSIIFLEEAKKSKVYYNIYTIQGNRAKGYYHIYQRRLKAQNLYGIMFPFVSIMIVAEFIVFLQRRDMWQKFNLKEFKINQQIILWQLLMLMILINPLNFIIKLVCSYF
ncbi:unnamed protein product [Paramecium pentaurelia]|uniref:Uncharacterized protein n=1 Tax=Paramecium pentaurelia TaxID=43138 RepID=A0A8S1TI57_9CILI|nr:unnamed protein product [Paramecium pentaurelia]